MLLTFMLYISICNQLCCCIDYTNRKWPIAINDVILTKGQQASLLSLAYAWEWTSHRSLTLEHTGSWELPIHVRRSVHLLLIMSYGFLHCQKREQRDDLILCIKLWFWWPLQIWKLKRIEHQKFLSKCKVSLSTHLSQLP